jgi:GntR family transcriptional regulator
MILKDNHIPLYLKLYWKLKDDIHFMELSPGERMPTVDELHKTYGVSGGTVRKSLELLEKDGLISKKRGLGVSVRDDVKVPPYNPVITGDTYKSDILKFDYLLISDGWIEVTNRIRNLFNGQSDVFQNSQIYLMESLLTRKEDHRRRNYAIAYIPAWIVNRVGVENLRASAPEGLIEFNEIKTDRMTLEARPWICNAEVGKILGVLEGSAISRNMCTHYSEENRILACVETIPRVNATFRELKLEW